MKDTLIKATAHDNKIRIFTCITTETAEKARQQHDLWPTSAAALGRVLSMAAMMGSMLKEEKEKVTIQINGGGPIGTIMADGCADGTVRGFVGDPEIYMKYNDTGKLAVGLAVGKEGYLKVIRKTGMKNDFTGQTALVSGEIGEDFAYYFTISEQVPSAVSVGVLIDTDNSVLSSGGIVIQMMPGAEEADIIAAEAAIRNLKPVSELIKEGKTAQDLAAMLFDEVLILEEKPISWNCGCGRDRFYAALTTIQREELEAMLKEDHGCEVKCEYCNNKYQFTEEDLNNILEFKAACGK